MLDIVTLANCVLVQNCGRSANGRPELDTEKAYLPPAGMSEAYQKIIIQDVLDMAKNAIELDDKQVQIEIADMLERKVSQHIINGDKNKERNKNEKPL